MKSHLIPDPKPIEPHLSSSDAARMYVLDQLFTDRVHRSQAQAAANDDLRRTPEMPMRNFLRVVMVR